MGIQQQLKDKLIKIKDNNGIIPEEVNKYELAINMLENIGSNDSELRDDLILSILSEMICNDTLTDFQVKEILELALGEKHLFYNIDKEDEDAIFNRAFSVLIVACILQKHNKTQDPTHGVNREPIKYSLEDVKDKLFTEDEILNIYNAVMKYFKIEKDVRGYVKVKGWAHSAAHTADAILQLVLCEEIKKEQLIEILTEIKEKICISYHVYVNYEEERLISAVIAIMERNILGEEEIINFIKGFEDINKTGIYPEEHYLMCNKRNFLSALYFRLRRRENMEKYLTEVEKVISNLTPWYFC